MNRQAKRGRQFVDLAIRVRNWGWYSLIKEESKLSGRALDNAFKVIDTDDGQRHFSRMRLEGAIAKQLVERNAKGSLFDKVHAGGSYSRAQRWFDSSLWKLLTTQNPSKGFISRFIREEERRAFGEGGLNQVFFYDEKALLRWLVSMPDIDGLPLLCALFRKAYIDFELDSATEYRRAIEAACQRRLQSLPEHANAPWPRCLEQLIFDRVLNNIWISELSWPEHEKPPIASRGTEIRAYINWYLSEKNPERPINWLKRLMANRTGASSIPPHRNTVVNVTGFVPDYEPLCNSIARNNSPIALGSVIDA